VDSLPPLELHLLGPPTIIIDGRPPPPDVLWNKHLGLLVYLALSPHLARARAHLQALLWPEKDVARARHSLNEALRRLRAGLGPARILSRRDTVALESRWLTIDVLTASTALVDAEFMEGFSLPDAPAFDDWLSLERGRLRGASLAAAVSKAEEHLAANDCVAARQVAERALRIDPLHEPAVRTAMRAAALGGDTSGALGLGADFARHCREELGADPSRSLDGLLQTIKTGCWKRPRPATRPRPPLLGRTRIHARAFTLMHRVPDDGLAVLGITGPAGSGRSRLLDEVVERWLLDGGRAVIARPVELDQDHDWSTLRQLFRHGLATADGLPGASPQALGVLAALVPELAERTTPRAAAGIGDVADALAAALRAIVEDGPVLVAIDDVEHADAHSIAALQAALSQLDDVRLGVVLTSTCLPNGSTAGAGLIGRIGRQVPGAMVRLDPLSPDDACALVDALASWCSDGEQRARLARRLYAETEGSPLLMTTLLQGLEDIAALREDAAKWPPPAQTLNAPVPTEVSHLAQLVTQARLQQLDTAPREFFIAATLGSRVVEPGVAGEVVGLGPPDVDRALAELESRGLLTFDGEHYVLPAPLLAAAAASAFLTRGQQQRLLERRREVLGKRAERTGTT